jgi:hypothetical protein
MFLVFFPEQILALDVSRCKKINRVQTLEPRAFHHAVVPLKTSPCSHRAVCQMQEAGGVSKKYCPTIYNHCQGGGG